MIDVLKSLRDAAIAVLMGARPYPTGTDAGPEQSVVETWRIKQLAEEIRKLNGVIEDDEPRLFNRADGVDGHYCIGRKSTGGDYYEFWNNGAWSSAGTVFDLTAAPHTRTESQG